MQYLPTRGHTPPEVAVTSHTMDEDTYVESLNNAVKEWFSRYRDMHCYLAVDPSQRDLAGNDGADSELFTSLPRADVIVDHDAFPKTSCPYLLKLDLSTPAGIHALEYSIYIAFEDRRPDSMAAGLGQRIGGWLASSASPDEIAAHWSHLVLQHDDSGRACALRFYDSRSLALLWTVLSQVQRQAMLGPVRAWHVLDARARPTIHLASAELRTAFILSAEQWRQIHRHGVINRALALHARTCVRQPEAVEIETAIAAAMRAEQHGLTDREDQLAFIGHALAWHPQFDVHPKVSQLLRLKPADNFYTSEIGQLSDDQINEIQQGAWYELLTAPTPRQNQRAETQFDGNV